MTIQRRTEIYNLPLAQFILKNYKEQLKQKDIKKLIYFNKAKNWNLVPVYRQGGIDLDGRNQCEKGLVVFSRKLRNTMAYQWYKDIDMVNAGFTYLNQLLNKYPELKVKAEWIISYFENRDEILQKTMDKNKCDRDEAKDVFIKKLFNGKDEVINEIVRLEMKERQDFKNYFDEVKENHEEYNPLGKTFAFMYHKWEWNTLSKIMEYFEYKRIQCFCDLHDGFFIKKNTDEDELGKVIDDVFEKFGVKMKVKNFNDLLDIPMEYIEDFKKANTKDEEQSYQYLKEKFESVYGLHKIISQNSFLLILGEQTHFKTESDLITCFKDWKEAGTETFSIYTETKKRFIYNYIQDPNKRVRERIDFYPNPNTCPSEVYNLFKGFHIKNFENCSIEKKDREDFETILSHFRFIVDDKSEVASECYEYLMDWFAHLFQYPHLKTNTMVILKGGEGIGKGIITKKIGYMMGQDYYFQTEDPASDLFGNYNSIGKSRLLINFDEGEDAQTKKFYEKLKNAITEDTKNVKEKYEKAMVLKNYSRYLMTTNNEAVIKISDTNRRFVGFECRHPRIEEFKDTIGIAFDNDKALYLLYQFFMNRDLSNRKWDKFPKTAYYKRCLDVSLPYHWTFINDYFTRVDSFKKYKKFSFSPVSECFEVYEAFCMEQRIKSMNRKDFVNSLNATNIIQQKKINVGQIFYFHQNEIIDKLKTMGIYEPQLFLDD